jgi:hypothetical protein
MEKIKELRNRLQESRDALDAVNSTIIGLDTKQLKECMSDIMAIARHIREINSRDPNKHLPNTHEVETIRREIFANGVRNWKTGVDDINKAATAHIETKCGLDVLLQDRKVISSLIKDQSQKLVYFARSGAFYYDTIIDEKWAKATQMPILYKGRETLEDLKTRIEAYELSR